MSNQPHLDSIDYNTRARLTSDVFQSYLYFVNFLLKNVISFESVGLIHDGRSPIQWFEQNRLKVIFDFSSEVVRKSDLPFLSKLQPSAIVAYNPFDRMNLAEIEKALLLIDRFETCAILAIHTSTNCEFSPLMPYSSRKWMEILSQLGEVTEIHKCDQYHMFLVTKHESSRVKAIRSL